MKCWGQACQGIATIMLTIACFGISQLEASRYYGSPKFKIELPKFMQECLQRTDLSSEGKVKNSEWQLICPYNQLIKNARAQKKKLNPAHHYIIGKIIHKQVISLRSQSIIAQQPIIDTLIPQLPTRSIATRAPSSTIDYFEPKSFDPRLHSFISSRINVVSEVKEIKPSWQQSFQTNVISLLAEGKFWLLPLINSKQIILNKYAALEWMNILGDAMQFSEALKFMDSHYKLLKDQFHNTSIIQTVLDWYDQHADSEIRKWLAEKVKEHRRSSLNHYSLKQYFFWVNHLRFNYDKIKKDEIATQFEILFYLFPDKRSEIKKLAGRINYNLKPKSPFTINAKLFLAYCKSLIKLIKTEEAQSLLTEAINTHSKKYDKDDLWQQFKLHARILRLLDQRDKIEATITTYLKKGKFFANPKEYRRKRKFTKTYFDRHYFLAKLYWNYVDNKVALKKVKDIIKKNLNQGTTYNLEKSYFVQARIIEQNESPARAIAGFENALTKNLRGEYRDNLLWRLLFRQFEHHQEKRNFVPALTTLETLKKVTKDKTGKAQVYYWYGIIYKYSGDKIQSKQYFYKAYREDPFSFYSNLAALEIKRTGGHIKDWKIRTRSAWLSSKNLWITPDWSYYFKTKSGLVKNKKLAPLARAYYLAHAGDFNFALRELKNMSVFLWRRLHDDDYFVNDRVNLGRTVAWLRLSFGDSLGALRTAEAIRSAFGYDVEGRDLDFLYPLSYQDLIFTEAKKRQVYPWLVISLIRQESAFNSRAVSSANAMGLMQVIPPVARNEAKLMGWEDFEPDELFKPNKSVQLGIHHLFRLLKDYNYSFISTTAGYNAGRPPLNNWLRQNNKKESLPVVFIERVSYPETRKYIKSILRNIINYKRIYDDGKIDIAQILRLPDPNDRFPADLN